MGYPSNHLDILGHKGLSGLREVVSSRGTSQEFLNISGQKEFSGSTSIQSWDILGIPGMSWDKKDLDLRQ